jgi:uncharacterized protein YjlB
MAEQFKDHEDDVLQDFGDVQADENEMIPASRYYDLIGEFSNLMKDKQRLRNQVAEMSDEIEGYQTFLQKAFEVIQQQQEQVEVLIRGESVEKISLIDFDNIMGPNGQQQEGCASVSHNSVIKTPTPQNNVNRLSVKQDRESAVMSPSQAAEGPRSSRNPSAMVVGLGSGYASEVGDALYAIDELLAQQNDLRTKNIENAMGNLKKVVDYGVSEMEALAQTKQLALNELYGSRDRKKVVQADVQDLTLNLKKIREVDETDSSEYESMREKILIAWESVCARLRSALKEEIDDKSIHSVARRHVSSNSASQGAVPNAKSPESTNSNLKTPPETPRTVVLGRVPQ